MPRKTAAAAPRLPANYQRVYDVVLARGPGRHATTADIYDAARALQPTIGYSTVYRALARLRDLGLIDEILIPGTDAALYEPASPAHGHFRCDVCGRIDDVAAGLSPQALRRLAESNGIDVREVSVIVHGRCASCRHSSPSA